MTVMAMVRLCMCMYVTMCMYMCACTHVSVYVCMHVCVCVYACLCIHVCVKASIHSHTSTNAYTRVLFPDKLLITHMMNVRLTSKPKALSISCPATSTCSKCHADCSVGQFRNGCGGVANGHGIGQCEACSNKPPGDEVTGVYYFYTSQGQINQNNCSYAECPSCPIGFVRVGCTGNAIGQCKPCANAKAWQYYSSDGHMGTGMCDVKACENAPKKVPGDGENGFYYIGAAPAAKAECAYERCDALPSCGVGKYRVGCGGANKVSGVCVWLCVCVCMCCVCVCVCVCGMCL